MERFSVHLVSLDPTRGSEIAKTRPAVVISPDEANRPLATVIIAPMTTVLRGWPSRGPIEFQGRRGEIALDQMRAVDKGRLTRRLGSLDETTAGRVLSVPAEMFAP